MPHSKLKIRPIWSNLTSTIKYPCSQILSYESERDEIMKSQMHDKYCDKASGYALLKEPKRAMPPKELQCRLAEFEKEFHK